MSQEQNAPRNTALPIAVNTCRAAEVLGRSTTTLKTPTPREVRMNNLSSTRVIFQPVPLEPFVEAEDAAGFLRMSPEYLKKLARAGKVPAHPRGDGQRRRWFFLLSELAEWMRGRVNSGCDPCSERR